MEWLPPNSFAIAMTFLGILGVGLIVARILMTSKSSSHLSELETRLDNGDDVAVLLLLEPRYPSFVEIISAVSKEFDLATFLAQEDFASALSELRQGVFSGAGESVLRASMCHIVRCFVDDPEVEFRCREPLSRLVDQFLVEIEASDGAAA